VEWVAPGSRVDGYGRITIKSTDVSGGPPITITARISYNHSLSGTAQLHVLDTWSASGPIVAQLVPGGAVPVVSHLDIFPNILFLGDGFLAADEPGYRTFVNSLVHHLRQPLHTPYDHLVNSMNIWCAFVPSPEAGISMGTEVVTITEADGSTRDNILSIPVAPPTTLGPNDVWADNAQMCYMVGRPVPADDVSNARTNAQVLADWIALYGADPTPHLGTTPAEVQDRITAWRRVSTRGLMDDVDSVLGVRSGNPLFDSFDQFNLNGSRMSRDRMDDLLKTIVAELNDAAGNPVQVPLGPYFTTHPDGVRGKDYDLICLVLPSHGRANNGDGYFFIGMYEAYSVLQGLGTNRYTWFPRPLPANATNDTGRILTHELSHSFLLEDEYGEADGPPTEPIDTTASNVMEEAHAKDAAGHIHGDEIRWRWHRIEHASVVLGPITPAPGGFTIPIDPNAASLFRELKRRGELPGGTGMLEVHLRERVIANGIPKRPKVSVPLRVTAVTDTDMTVTGSGTMFNYPNVVQAADIVAQLNNGAIVYKPVPAPAGAVVAGTYPYAELVARNVREYITAHQAPLTAFPSVRDTITPQAPNLARGAGLVPRAGFPAGSEPRIVGLYSGGSRFHLGVFHPAGQCMMREDHVDGAEFCAVCRYILAERIDPRMHRQVDASIAPFYPEA
jgi:hypothetical protein